jgi:hypothetical protein
MPPGISVSLELSAEVVSTDKPLALDLSLRNNRSTPVAHWTGGQKYELWIDGPDGVVWVWSYWLGAQNQGFFDIAERDVLDPGEVQHGRAHWRYEDCQGSRIVLPPGEYSARGLWVTGTNFGTKDHGWWSDVVKFELR